MIRNVITILICIIATAQVLANNRQYWPDGSMENFDWYDGYNTKGLFGVPTYYSGNDLWFASANFDLTANSSKRTRQ